LVCTVLGGAGMTIEIIKYNASLNGWGYEEFVNMLKSASANNIKIKLGVR
jgi:hypothetical protein